MDWHDGGIPQEPRKTVVEERTVSALAHVWVFFYGTFMSPGVLMEPGITPCHIVPAKLNGFELAIRPRVNLIACCRSSVYGVVTEVAHEDLTRVYSDLDERFGLKYFPYPVVAEALDGAVRLVLSYIAPHIDDAPATKEYVKELAEAVRVAGLPEWYAELVESFGP